MDWLKTHIHEVILPNVEGEVQELTGITLDDSLGEFEVLAEPLDDEDDGCEEFEITIKKGELLLVDACFLLEEVEGGYLPLCQSEEDLTRELIEAKLKVLRDRAIPIMREEFAQELTENDWNPKLAHLLDIMPEVLEDTSGLRSSGGYPPMVLTFRHPEYDPDAFEIQTRIDPMANEDWVDWKKLMREINAALKAIGEERQKTAAAPDDEEGVVLEGVEAEPSPDDLADDEIAEIEGDLVTEAPVVAPKEAAGKEKAGKGGKGGKAASSLLASLEKTLGIALGAEKAPIPLDDDEEGEEPGFDEDESLDDEEEGGKRKAAEKAKKSKGPAAKKSPGSAKKAPAAKKSAAKAPAAKKAKR